MKSNKEKICDFFKLHFSDGAAKGLSTQYLTECFGIQRTNMSSILNSLVKEGRIKKSSGRPVLYYMDKDLMESTNDCFSSLIGFDGSLKRVVQLAKAAVLYPQRSLHTLLIGATGTGKGFLAMLMHKFAVESGVLSKDAPLITFDSKGYIGNPTGAIDAILSNKEMQASNGCVLLIDNAECLDVGARSMISARLLEGDPLETSIQKTMIIISCNTTNRNAYEDYASKVPIVIELPLLRERPLKERMEIIRTFFTLESARLNRILCINAEVLRCLLLYDCELNVLQLKADIKIACANAFVRNYKNKDKEFRVYIGDFEHHVRKGFLHYKAFRDEIEQMIPFDYSYAFSESTMEMSAIDKDKLKNRSMYDDLERRIIELSDRGMDESNISMIISAEVENVFRQYQSKLTQEIVNKEQLSKLVDIRIISMVESFLDEASVKLSKVFPTSVFYGLCLHVNAVLKQQDTMNSIPTRQITEIIENFKAEYTMSLQFASLIEEEFSVSLPIDEVVLITMFICYKAPMEDIAKKPVMLFAFYGKAVASSYINALKTLTHHDNVYAYEINFEKESEVIYNELKNTIVKIDRGAGVIVVYDMSLLGPMLDTIEVELKTIIKRLPTNITSVGLELSRKAAIDENIDSVFNSVSHIQTLNNKKKKKIVTLCSTGEGAAQELKNYVKRYGDVSDMEIVPLGTSDTELLKEQISDLLQTDIIHCIIGTFNPRLFAIPFISISDVLSAPKAALPSILRLKRIKKSEINFDDVYAYLEEQLISVDISKLKRTLPMIIEQINARITHMSLDSEVGLFIHIACCINRILSGELMPKNLKKDDIIERHKKQYKELVKLIKPIEKAFGIILNDDEVANILTIINKL